MRLVYSILLIFTFYYCSHPKTTINTFKTNGFVLVDTATRPAKYLSQENPDYPIYYIGPFSDTIHIGRKYLLGRTKIANWPTRLASSRSYTSRNLDLFVDTSIKTNNSVEYLNKNGVVDYDSTPNYYSYVVTIKNISDSNIWMGRTFSLFFLHLEGQDKTGHWVKINKSISELGICGTFQPHIYLKPGNIILAKMPVYNGKYVTNCRLVFGFDNGHLVYSNVFKEALMTEVNI
jgi:hypothetical protein